MKSFRLTWDNFIFSPNRQKGTKNFFVSFLIILISLFIALFICMIIYKKGSLFGDIFYQIFTAPFAKGNINFLFCNIGIFAAAACSFIFAFKCGLFNIGISGQMLFSAMICEMIGQHMSNVPNVLGQLIMLIIAIVMGGLIGTLIGFLKAKFNMNEVVSSIMINWIVYFAGTYMLKSACKIDQSGIYSDSLSSNLLMQINGHGAVPLILLALLVIGVCFVVFKYLVFGKKITDVGLSLEGSKYAGYSVKTNQLLSMTISGAIAGILGIMVYFGKSNGNIPTEITAKAIPIEGFNGISVGLIAMNNPIGVIPVSFLFGMIDTSKSQIAQACGVDSNITDLMFGIIVYGAAIVSLLYYLKPWRLLIKHLKKYQHLTIPYEEYEFNVQNQINEYLDAKYLINKKYLDSLFHKDQEGYYENNILTQLNIGNEIVKGNKQRKALLNKLYEFYETNRLTKEVK